MSITPDGTKMATAGPASWPPLLRDFWRLAGPYWGPGSPERMQAWTLTGSLVLLTLAQVALAIGLNVWNQRFFDAIGAGALELFLRLIVVFALIVLGNVVINVVHLWVKRRLQIGWRNWLTHRLVDAWMASGQHYRLGQAPGDPDNPDGRIAEDIRIATEYAVELANSAVYSNLVLISFIGILWSLSGVVTVPLGSMSFDLPGHLVWIGLIYALLGIWAALLVGRTLSPAANRRQAAEADFRFGLARARENALGIALLGGEADERRRFYGLFQSAIAAWNRQTRALARIFAYTSSWSLLSGVFPILVAAPRFIAGSISLGTLMQSAQALQQMTSAMSWPVDNLTKAADWRASVERVRDLQNALTRQTAPDGGAKLIRHDEGLEFRHLSLAEPDGRVVIDALDLKIAPGELVVATGPSDVTGKLFTAMAGLWPWSRGEIFLPPGEAVFFVPQRSYLPVGELRDAVCYPTPPDLCGDAVIAQQLQRVGLGALVPRLHEAGPWERLLSADEQQRLAFARVLLHRPALILLYDATNALDAVPEAELIALLARQFPQASVLALRHHGEPTTGFSRHLFFQRSNGHVTLQERRL